jgi:hypothetical protein
MRSVDNGRKWTIQILSQSGQLGVALRHPDVESLLSPNTFDCRQEIDESTHNGR